MSKRKADQKFDPEKYGMIFCPNCSGSGKSFTGSKGADVCKVCGGCGLLKQEEKGESQTKVDRPVT